MIPKPRSVLVLAAVTTALVGCSLTQSALRDDGPLGQKGGGRRVIAPKMYVLDVMILTRPQGDRALNDAVWRVADEQVVEPAVARALQSNGLRAGRVTGDLPAEVQSLFTDRGPDRPAIQTISYPDGEAFQIDPAEAPPRPKLELLMSLADGKVSGKSYQDAKAVLRGTGSFDEADGVTLRIAPELHHGPVSQGYGVAPTGGVPSPREFRITNGQKEETFRDLTVSIDLRPGQVAVLGNRPEKSGSLGDVLFQKPDGNSDRVLQSLVLIWARRAGAGPNAIGRVFDPPASLEPVDPAEFGPGGSASPGGPARK
jgi:hypothetical protein